MFVGVAAFWCSIPPTGSRSPAAAPSCTQDYLPQFARLGGSLLGISTDQILGVMAPSHGPLASTTRCSLTLTRKELCVAPTAYMTRRRGTSSRSLFVLDEHCVIHWSKTYPAGVNPGVDGILTALER